MSNKGSLIFVYLTVAITLSNGFNIRPMVHVDLLDSLLQIPQSMRSPSPEQNTKCFQIYTPELTKLSDAYKTEYNKCVSTAENSKEAIIKEVAGNVDSITQMHNEICNGYNSCQGSEIYPFFECNSKAASDSVSKSFQIQTMAKDRMQYVKLRTEMVEYDVKTCTDKSTQAYTVNSKQVYDQLQACMAEDATAKAH